MENLNQKQCSAMDLVVADEDVKSMNRRWLPEVPVFAILHGHLLLPLSGFKQEVKWIKRGIVEKSGRLEQL